MWQVPWPFSCNAVLRRSAALRAGSRGFAAPPSPIRVNTCRGEKSRNVTGWLPPVTLQRECGPVIGRAPAFDLGQGDLGVSQRGGRSFAASEHRLVEALHQLGGRAIVDLPQAGHDARNAGVHEPAREADQPFTCDVLPECGLARREHDQVGAELQVVNVVYTHEAVLRAT